MAYNRNEIFQAIGKFIARFNELEVQKGDLETIWSEQIAVLNVSDETRRLLERGADTATDQRETVDDMKAATKADVTTYITTELREMLDVVEANSIPKVLDALQDAMYLAVDTVEENVIPPPEDPLPGGPDDAFDIDNGGVALLYIIDFHSQQTHDDIEFLFECISVTGTIGEETWNVKAKRTNGTVETIGSVVTGSWIYSEKYGKAFRIVSIAAIIETNDGANQLSNWVLAGTTKRKGDEWTESITRANASWYGIYYAELTDAAGTRKVELFRDLAKTEKVATGTRVGDGTLVLAAAGGSGLTGSVDVAYTGDDLDIYIIYPFELEVGDRANYVSAVTTPAIFQTFFVEEYDKALPASDAPTVTEAWAEWTP